MIKLVVMVFVQWRLLFSAQDVERLSKRVDELTVENERLLTLVKDSGKYSSVITYQCLYFNDTSR